MAEEFASEHERWSEAQAVQCERNIEELLKSAKTSAERVLENIALGLPNAAYINLSARSLLEVAERVNAYSTMADNFRRGRWARLESEAYAAHAKGNQP